MEAAVAAYCDAPSAPGPSSYAGRVRGKLALIVVALVVLPAVAFVVARDHKAPVVVQFYGPVVPSQVWLKQEVTRWLANHPGGKCTIEPDNSAYCTAADGSSVALVAGTTTVATTP